MCSFKQSSGFFLFSVLVIFKMYPSLASHSTICYSLRDLVKRFSRFLNCTNGSKLRNAPIKKIIPLFHMVSFLVKKGEKRPSLKRLLTAFAHSSFHHSAIRIHVEVVPFL